MGLVGTSSLQIAPVADRNEIRIASNWPHPSFGPAWSPDELSIASGGFDATWRITSVATGGRAKWDALASGRRLQGASGAGVFLFDPVNVYTLAYRATQYAFLFVLFTFCALALTEVLAGIRLHPVQYALVGSAVAIFVALYAALYEILQSEDNALLLGSLMVFFLLATAMIATRKLDWSGLSGRMAASRAASASP
jgi:inner membrane protein